MVLPVRAPPLQRQSRPVDGGARDQADPEGTLEERIALGLSSPEDRRLLADQAGLRGDGIQ
eukprot:12318177-Alexandrium_andersonii.AAC.1